MKIVFAGSMLGAKAGPGVHATNVMRQLIALRPQDEFVSFQASRRRQDHQRAVRETDPSGRLRARGIPLPGRVLHLPQTYLRFPPMRWLLGESYDLFHQMWVSTDPAVPSHKLVVSMYDTAALIWPGQDGTLFRGAGRMLRRAAAVTTLSEYSRKCIVEAFGVDPQRIHITYSGCNHDLYHDRYDPEQTREALGRLGVSGPYLLFAGGQSPRKNLPRIIEAFATARRRGGLPHQLVLAGPLDPPLPNVAEAIERSGCGASIRILGYVTDDAIPHLYRGADALVFATLFEGFGLPVVEAMACGTPVVTSTASSLPEVAGDACAMVDPESIEAIAAGILQILGEDADARRRRIQRGLTQARKFSWQNCAERHIAVYQRVLAAADGPARMSAPEAMRPNEVAR